MTIKEQILKAFKSEMRALTTEDLEEIIGIDKDIIRAIINKSMKGKSLIFIGDWKNHHKLYKLINDHNFNDLFKETRKGFRSFSTLFRQITKKMANQKSLTLEDYISLVSEYINRDFIKLINKRLNEVKS